jgi:nitrile hydratase beta subunit
MNGVHDMGGMHGFGRIERDEPEPVFHYDWERRVFAMRVGSTVPIPGGSRYNIEQMPPEEYLNTSYYEKWLHARLKGFIDAGVLTEEEFAARLAQYRNHPALPVPHREEPERVGETMERLLSWKSPRREQENAPRFRVGDPVRARNMHPPAHTRLPRYVRGKRGMVTRYYGVYDLQDTLPAGVKRPVQPLYAVRFDGQEIWGESAEAKSVVYLDMWESYLEPA